MSFFNFAIQYDILDIFTICITLKSAYTLFDESILFKNAYFSGYDYTISGHVLKSFIHLCILDILNIIELNISF